MSELTCHEAVSRRRAARPLFRSPSEPFAGLERGPTLPSAGLRAGDPLPGTAYVVIRLVGQGGMGEVYEVEHRSLGRRAALKVLHRRHVDRPDLAARLREEARMSARLRHPNLVEVFDLGVTGDGRPYFAMPLLAGRDLRTELHRSGPFAPDAAVALVGQALAGLGAAHEAGLVHRDVKLENLFLERDGTVRVLDFGIAKLASGAGPFRTDPGVSPGTPRTMAPEQCAGRAVDPRTDLYAVGLALYELLTGRGPFDDVKESPHALRFAHSERAPRAPSELAPRPIPPALDRAILRALAKSPSARYGSAAEMAAALRAALVAPPAPVSITPPAARPWWDRAWLGACVVASALALVAIGAAFGRALPAPGAADRRPPPGLGR